MSVKITFTSLKDLTDFIAMLRDPAELASLAKLRADLKGSRKKLEDALASQPPHA